ncbi:tumor necrosis factor receptor superfamily member 13C [Talpa occidentalis]|uniref:tumor necrosis factor receptor superfamily member 13C n=1 Tax=Talpa occidentalis TaxID=50954 RepID=UPI00188FB3A8|nr:tumor necrosis factor receptor superfamily member 13C [Talpa occidentalis]
MGAAGPPEWSPRGGREGGVARGPARLPAGPGAADPVPRAQGGRSMGRGPGSPPGPARCREPQCFDLLVRGCVSCSLLRTPPPRPAGASPQTPWTAPQPLESGGPGAAGAELPLPLPALLFGAPAGLGLALALALLALLGWRWRRRPGRAAPAASPEAPDAPLDEPLDDILVIPPGPLDASAPIWPPPRGDPAPTPPAHSVPVPATELGSTELVTTKTAGPEPQ